MTIYNQIHNMTTEENLDIEDFQSVVIYLLENGVICREDGQKEENLYDLFVRLEHIIIDYFIVIKLKVVHNSILNSVRVYSLSSETPNQEFIEDDSESKNFVSNLSSEESAYLLALTIYYNQKSNEGELNDDLTVEIDLEDFNTVLATSLGFEATDNKTQREKYLKTLKGLKAIEYSANNVFEDEDKPLIIRPLIKDIVLPSMIEKYILENDKEEKEVLANED